MKTPVTIDFNSIVGPVYVGRERGENLRAEFKMDALDKNAQVINVIIPDSIYTMSSSFFLGMFGPSIQCAGTRTKFFTQYHFTMPDFLKEIIDAHVSYALQRYRL